MDLELIQSPFGWIPKCDGKLLHSTVDPIKEAVQLVERHWYRICDVKTVIVFGIGGGFHIAELLKRKKKQILIIDFDENLVEQIVAKNSNTFRKTAIVSTSVARDVINGRDLRQATSGSYAVLPHPASVRLQQDYYNEIQNFLTHRSVDNILRLVEKHKTLSQYLERLELSGESLLNLHQIESAIKNKNNHFEKESMIWMILRELVV